MAEALSKSQMKKSVYLFFKTFFYILYKVCVRVRFFGLENIPEPKIARGVILAPNHQSYIDPPLTGLVIKPYVTYFAKEYLFQKRFLGWFLRSVGVLPVSNKKDDFRIIRAILKLLKEGHYVTIFPEGTRSPDGKLQKPQSGVGFLAMKSGAIVVPVYIKGTYEVLPRYAKWIRFKPVEVHYGKPFIPLEDEQIKTSADTYQAVGDRIMEEICQIRKRVDSFGVAQAKLVKLQAKEIKNFSV